MTKYKVVFEFQSEDSSMSDVYNCSNEQQALEKFAELKDSLEHAVHPATCQVTDEPDLYGLIDRQQGIYGFVRIDAEEN